MELGNKIVRKYGEKSIDVQVWDTVWWLLEYRISPGIADDIRDGIRWSVHESTRIRTNEIR